MAEPTTLSGAGIVTVSVAVLGPMTGEYAAIVLSALAGSLWALSERKTETRREGAFLMLRLVMTSGVLSGTVAAGIEAAYDVPAHLALAPVAFGIAFMGNRWRGIFDLLLNRFIRRNTGSTQ